MLALCDARELNPLWVLQRGLRGASTPRYHRKKFGCLVSLLFLSSIYFSLLSLLLFTCLFVELGFEFASVLF